jgi:hypothetical protein
MKKKQKIAAIVLVALLGAVAYGLFRTGQPASVPAMNAKTASGGAAQAPIVDQTPLLTAQRLAQMPPARRKSHSQRKPCGLGTMRWTSPLPQQCATPKSIRRY